MSEAERELTKTVQSVETAFRIVKELETMEDAGVSTLADAIDTPVSTVYAHLNTLRQLGYVVKTGTHYRLGHRFLQHAGVVRESLKINRIARQEVHNLANFTGEVAGYGVEEDGQRVMLHRSKNDVGIFDNIHVGEYTNLHWTSIGKAILAHLPEERQHDVIDQHGLPRSTSNTITRRNALFDEFETIRERGYAVDDEERRKGIRGVAVPVKDQNDDVLGAIGVAGPRHRFTAAYLGELAQFLQYRKNLVELEHNYYE